MHSFYYTLIFFLYGLAFFSMGSVILLEVSRCNSWRLRHGLYFLAAFGLLHGLHEWYEMFLHLDLFPPFIPTMVLSRLLQIALLSLSFLALATFGMALIAPNPEARRLGLLMPLSMAALWSFGALALRGEYGISNYLDVLDPWTRYTLAIPSALLACAGLVVQQREFRRAGMSQFGRDALWAAIAFAWYGLIGQIFVTASPLHPSDYLNADLFLEVFGFPIQLLRAGSAVLASIFVVRFLRSFEVETQHKIDALQAARLSEAERREQVYGELLRRVVAAQENERQRIARELHDETGQALTAIGLGLRGVSTQMHGDTRRASNNLRQLEGLVDSSLVELQRLIADLRPSHLDDLGLPAALRWYAHEVQSRANLKVSVEIQGEAEALPPEVNTALFRVAQEALTNVVRHARAACASIRLIFRCDAVLLEVTDDGCGFDPQVVHTSNRPSWGLLGMEERANLLGGQLSIVSEVDKGTTVQMIIPFYQVPEVQNGRTPGISG